MKTIELQLPDGLRVRFDRDHMPGGTHDGGRLEGVVTDLRPYVDEGGARAEVLVHHADTDGLVFARFQDHTGNEIRRIEVHPDFDTSTFERLVGILERA